MINENFEITYGVELELVFAFRQDLLQGHLDSVPDNSMIIKNLSDTDREYMANQYFGYSGRPSYMGWGLTTRIAHPLIGYNIFGQIRTYGDEPMQIARSQFPSMFFNVGLHFAQARQTDFSRWHLTHDSSLRGVTKETLMTKLGARIRNVRQCKSFHPPLRMTSQTKQPIRGFPRHGTCLSCP